MPNYGQYFIAVRLMLLKRFLETNAGRNRIITRRQMEDYLESQGYQVEKKTLYIDLDYLQARFGLKLEYDPHKKGYRLLNPPFEPHELRLIVDGIQSSKFITAEKARELSNKIRHLGNEETQQELARTSQVFDRVRSMNESVVNEADRIHQAIAGDFKIGFRYFHYTPSPDGKKNYSKSGNQYIVSPYALLWNNGNYYLYAYDSESKKFRYFRVDRMERISEPLPYHRDGKDEYSEKKLTRQKVKVFNMYSGKEYNVRIRFRNELADAVVDEFGKDVMMIPCDESHFTVTVPVEISPPFFAWIATFGRRVKILSPEPVVEKMKDFIQRCSDMYKDEG